MSKTTDWVISEQEKQAFATPHYSAPLYNPPASKRQGIANAVQLAINTLEAGDTRETMLQLVDLLSDIDSISNPYKLDTTGEKRSAPLTPVAPHVIDPYEQIARVDLLQVPVMSADRCIPRKKQAALARKLFKQLGIKGVSVTAPNYSMAQCVDVKIPCEPHPGWVGFEQWEHYPYSDIPNDVPAKAHRLRHRAASEKIEAILNVAFPNHDNRSDSMTDYSDYCWSIS